MWEVVLTPQKAVADGQSISGCNLMLRDCMMLIMTQHSTAQHCTALHSMQADSLQQTTTERTHVCCHAHHIFVCEMHRCQDSPPDKQYTEASMSST